MYSNEFLSREWFFEQVKRFQDGLEDIENDVPTSIGEKV